MCSWRSRSRSRLVAEKSKLAPSHSMASAICPVRLRCWGAKSMTPPEQPSWATRETCAPHLLGVAATRVAAARVAAAYATVRATDRDKRLWSAAGRRCNVSLSGRRVSWSGR